MLARSLLLLLAILPVACSTSAVLTETESISYSVDDATAHSAILQGVARRKWNIQEESPSLVIARLSQRRHRVVVSIEYGAGQIRFHYKDSEYMDYRKRGSTEYIHRKYSAWTRNLANAIRSALDAEALKSARGG